MAIQKRDGGLSPGEKSIAKALLNRKWRNQDIQALINSGGRKATVNSARITGVKQDEKIVPASDAEVEAFLRRKKAFDPTTGLNLIDDERLIRSREAMILAVQVFNGPGFLFKTELFAVLANIARTYLLHEYYSRREVNIVGKDGQSLLLGQMLDRGDCPLSGGVKRNLRTLKQIRDEVEHLLLGRSDFRWASIFQACCLNFDAALRRFFGDAVSLEKELSFALQFARLDVVQIAATQKYDVPEAIEALDARLRKDLTEEQLADLEYQFRVVFTLDNATKSKAHFQFVEPYSKEGDDIRRVLLKYKVADELYPFKASRVADLVRAGAKRKFTVHNHTQAWKFYKARPEHESKEPGNKNKDFCIYHSAHKDHTYSPKWVDHLIKGVSSDQEFSKIMATKN